MNMISKAALLLMMAATVSVSVSADSVPSLRGVSTKVMAMDHEEDLKYLQTYQPSEAGGDDSCGENWQKGMCDGAPGCEWQGHYCAPKGGWGRCYSIRSAKGCTSAGCHWKGWNCEPKEESE